MLRDEGYTKYRCHHSPGELPDLDYTPLLQLRDALHAARLIGRYPDGIGYGNVSIRVTDGLVVTATQTGHLPRLEPAQLNHVYRCLPAQNELWCRGALPASSEAMTHYSIYATLPQVQVIAHVHHAHFWEQHLHQLPTTAADVPYGTPAMALAVEQLLRLEATGIFLTAGHAEGVFLYAATLPELQALIGRYFQ
ncbi:MAG: class II aldolase/adducin family protein [Bacteroidetes bacterium]|nr:class II aldolase/adducin family protein [Bacteroidota bacterium]